MFWAQDLLFPNLQNYPGFITHSPFHPDSTRRQGKRDGYNTSLEIFVFALSNPFQDSLSRPQKDLHASLSLWFPKYTLPQSWQTTVCVANLVTAYYVNEVGLEHDHTRLFPPVPVSLLFQLCSDALCANAEQGGARGEERTKSTLAAHFGGQSRPQVSHPGSSRSRDVFLWQACSGFSIMPWVLL